MEYPQTKEGQSVEQARDEINAQLGVSSWRALPSSTRVETVVESDEGPVPYWWHGDEDASSTFLASMGVVLEPANGAP